ncbi:unnamed protein product, partial [Amoebophrya sp. A120]
PGNRRGHPTHVMKSPRSSFYVGHQRERMGGPQQSRKMCAGSPRRGGSFAYTTSSLPGLLLVRTLHLLYWLAHFQSTTTVLAASSGSSQESTLSASAASSPPTPSSSASEDWQYNFAEIRAVCKETAECPADEMRRLFEAERTTKSSAEIYYDDDHGDARIAVEAMGRELLEIFSTRPRPRTTSSTTNSTEQDKKPENDEDNSPASHSLLRKLFIPRSYELVRYRAVSMNGNPAMIDVTESGTPQTGPWAIRFSLQIPEPGYTNRNTNEFLTVVERNRKNGNPSTTTRIAGKNRPIITEWWREKMMHYYAGLTFNVEVRFNRNYPFSAPRVSIHNNVEHAFLGGQQRDDRHAHVIPQVFFTRSAGKVLKTITTKIVSEKRVKVDVERQEEAPAASTSKKGNIEKVNASTTSQHSVKRQKKSSSKKKKKSKTVRILAFEHHEREDSIAGRSRTSAAAVASTSSEPPRAVDHRHDQEEIENYFLAVPYRFTLADALEKTLCFLTYIDAALLSLPFLTEQRADALRSTVKQHAAQAWFDKRQNLFVYPALYARNQDFFNVQIPDDTEYVLAKAKEHFLAAARASSRSGQNINKIAAWSASSGVLDESKTHDASVVVPQSNFPEKYLHPEFRKFQKEYEQILRRAASTSAPGQHTMTSATEITSSGLAAAATTDHEEAARLSTRTSTSASLSRPSLPLSAEREVKALINERFLQNATDGCPNVYSFPLFTDEFCDLLVSEIRGVHDSQLKVQRPNSMNNYGVILNDVGLEPLMDAIQNLLRPLGQARFGAVGSNWDGHHSFIVQYSPRKDTHLDMHTDDSDVTINIALGIGQFSGSEVRFCGKMGKKDHRKNQCVYTNKKGTAIMHLGRHRHGAMEITEGERMNLILWNRGTSYRETYEYDFNVHERESGPPDKVCVSYTHDRDYGRFKTYPVGQEHQRRKKKWCPQKRVSTVKMSGSGRIHVCHACLA